MNNYVDKIKEHLHKIAELEKGLSLFSEDEEEYIGLLAKIQQQFYLISDEAMEVFKELTIQIRNTGQKRIQRGIDQLPQTIKESVSEEIKDMKRAGELFD
ncbi:hypothetical protein PWO45_09925 [Bacillus amyloliquefaciens]|uniref:hypothetical protein n=1 Tax=Bacillus amyloliquefaciens group TaxID=1938374 RepID=UPI000DEB4E81|nr:MULTISPECIES: hypothetical protein [Bacillus amyloliquefaciens group]MDE5154300.1 hypothetical protein [Bacillus amyloliquefaciens]RBY99948.1 hypothetical protein DSD26_10690 [Bacillus velezensis]TXK25920.1 hypothetical protein FVD42_04905 [Bacillus amyloliquefaciens]TXK32496.1 hypothetical protein FVD41_05090 [Bacillus amyloliquefaciens]WBY35380.1 hypothetical protein PF976_09245 [Bacillus amyloliquefaciens]